MDQFVFWFSFFIHLALYLIKCRFKFCFFFGQHALCLHCLGLSVPVKGESERDSVDGHPSHCLGNHLGHRELMKSSMSLFREIPPTAGLLLYWRDCLSILKAMDSKDVLESDFKKYLNNEEAGSEILITASIMLVYNNF
jgi:hypothetical protein